MQEFMQFVVKHWILWLAFVLLVILIIIEEMRGKIGGIPRLTPSELTQLINRDAAIVIDLRDKTAFDAGHITGAIQMLATELEANPKKLEKYKTKTIALVSATDVATGIKPLQTAGYNLATLSGGISGWRQAGLPLVKN